MPAPRMRTWTLGGLFLGLLVVAGACGGSDSESDESLVSASGGSAGSSSGGNGSGGGSSSGGTLNVGIGGVDGSGDGGALNCGETKLEAAPPIVNVLLVVDRSSSMSFEPSGFGTTRWNALKAGLEAAVDAAKARVSFGIDFFPSTGSSGAATTDACQTPQGSEVLVPIEPGESAAPKIADALADNPPPESGASTPTAAALRHALAYFTEGAGADLDGERYVLLATDGGPNCNASAFPDGCGADACTVNIDEVCPVANCCNSSALAADCLDEDGAVEAVESLLEAGVKTFVVGIPGTEAYEGTLDAMAVAGKVPNSDAPPSYYAVSEAGGVEALSATLTRITTGLITSCRLELEKNPPVEGLVNVVVDGEKIPRDADGWDFDKAASPWTVVLQGETCERVENAGAEDVIITFGCPTVQ